MYTDIADNILTLSGEMEQTQSMLRNIELEGIKIGLKWNAKKTEMMPFNHDNVVDIKSKDEYKIKSVENFKYRREWINKPEKNFEIRKAQA